MYLGGGIEGCEVVGCDGGGDFVGVDGEYV